MLRGSRIVAGLQWVPRGLRRATGGSGGHPAADLSAVSQETTTRRVRAGRPLAEGVGAVSRRMQAQDPVPAACSFTAAIGWRAERTPRRRNPNRHASDRSTIQRYRPSRSLAWMPRRAMRGAMPRERRARRFSDESYALSGWNLAGRKQGCPGRPRGPTSGGMASCRGSSSFESWTFAAERRTASGIPLRSTTRWDLLPRLPRSAGFGPISAPPRLARTLTLSMLARERSMAPHRRASSAARRAGAPRRRPPANPEVAS
jgi:hypothetical protein